MLMQHNIGETNSFSAEVSSKKKINDPEKGQATNN